MENKIYVSVVVSVYNTEKYLDQCLGSLAKQSLENVEFIIVNNASSDNSINIIKKWASIDNRFVIVETPNNLGPGGGKNLGIKKAKGIYIGLLDSDDYISSDMYDTLLSNSDNLTKDIVISNYYKAFENSDKDYYNFKNVEDSMSLSLQDLKKNICTNGCRLWTSIIRRSIFIDNNLLYPENIGWDDNAIGTCIYLKADSIKIVDNIKPYYFYRINNSSETRSLDNPKYWDRLTTASMFYNHSKRLEIYNEFKSEIEYRFYYLYYRTFFTSFGYFSKIQFDKIKEIKMNYKKISDGYDIGSNKYFIKKATFFEKIGIAFYNIDYLWDLYVLIIYFLWKIKSYKFVGL